MQERVIKWWTGDNWFLDNSYEVPIVFQNLCYPSVSHAFMAAQTDNLDLKIRISHSPLIALKRLVNEIGDPHSGFEGPNTMRKLLEYKYGVKQDMTLVSMTVLQSNLAKRLIGTGTKTLVYGNKSCSTFYGDCDCPKHFEERGKNVLGGLTMGIRSKLIDYATKDVSRTQLCSCEKINDGFFLYAINGKLWLKPFCGECQAKVAVHTAQMDDGHGIYRFEKDWFPVKKEPVNKIVVPHRHHNHSNMMRPDIFPRQTQFDEDEWERGWNESGIPRGAWGVWRGNESSSVPDPKLPKNVTFYLSGRIS